MATRIYLPSSGVAAILPAYSASWTDATSYSAAKLRATLTRGATGYVTKPMTGSVSDDQHYCVGMWVTDRLSPQSIPAQTVTCSIKVSETNVGNNLYLHMIIRLVAADGVTFLDVCSFDSDATTEHPLTAAIASRFWTATSTARTAVGGDRLVIELGAGGNPTGSNVHSGSMIIGDANASNDLLGSDGDTNAYNPWVNFSTTSLLFMRRRIAIWKNG